MKINDELSFFLLLLAVLLLIKIAYPALSSITEIFIAALIIFFTIELIKRKRNIEKHNEEINKKCNEFWRQHAEIRKKYDPLGIWNEATHLPSGYIDEMKSLNEEYGAFLDEKRNR